MWATAAALQSPYPLACSVNVGADYQDRTFDWMFRSVRRHLKKALGRMPAVLVVKHHKPQPHLHLSLAARPADDVPKIERALRDAAGTWRRSEVYQVEIRSLYSVGFDPELELLVGGKPKPNEPGWATYMITGARTSGSITYSMTNVMRHSAQQMHHDLGLHKSKSTPYGNYQTRQATNPYAARTSYTFSASHAGESSFSV